MKCPSCQKENKSASHFCIFCGSPLLEPETEQSTKPTQDSMDTTQQELMALREEVSRLKELIKNQSKHFVNLNDRLAALEGAEGLVRPVVKPTPITLKAVTPPPSPPSRARPERAREREWEWILGGNWLARIGVLALIIGVAFLLKLAADNEWIGPIGWIALGIVAGLAMLGLGYYWKRKYPTLAQAITGGGIAILYLSAFAAFALFDLINFYLATGFLLVVSITSATLSLRHNSMALAIIGIFGAFSAPFILAGFAEGATAVTEVGRSAWLLVYVIVVDLGVLALSTFRNWRWFTLLALLSSLAAFGAWYSRFGDEASLLTSQGSLTLIFLIFVGATTLYHIVWRRAAQEFDYALMVINAAAYFGISYGLLRPDLREWMGGFTFALSLFYGGLAYVALKRGVENIRLSFFALGISLIFLTIAIPIQLGDVAWVTIAWAAEGAVLIWLSLIFRIPLFRVCSYAVFAAMAVRLLFFDTEVDLATFQPVLNERFLAFLIGITALYFASWREMKALRKSETTWSYYHAFLVAANFLTLWLLSAEIINYFDSRLVALAGDGSGADLSLTGLWAFYAVIVLVVGIVKRSRFIRLAALALLAVPIIKVFAYDVIALEQVYRIIAFVGLGILLITSGYLYQRYSKSIKGFFINK